MQNNNKGGHNKGKEAGNVYGQPFAFTAPKIVESLFVDLTDKQKSLLPKIKVSKMISWIPTTQK